jgi:hypothetical protein
MRKLFVDVQKKNSTWKLFTKKAFAFVVNISTVARLSPQSKGKKGESSMVQPTPLHYVNRGEPGQTRCFNCGNILGSERCAANTSQGPKWFCRHEGDDPFDSCYNIWQMRQPKRGH